MRLSVVINTYNRSASLARTLEALEFLRYDPFEVVVVNGPSTDSTEQILRELRGSDQGRPLSGGQPVDVAEHRN